MLSQLRPRRFGKKRRNPKAKVGIGRDHITVRLAVGSSDKQSVASNATLAADMTV
ncbi:hypothetical protein sS8_4765 [Methylocaldum marinum]|uniref:Uncharacterized protein n=1 Tax=Methylocaldum marinum TaxID=1432792 RepID=A0A250KYD2_9GAMM|nr:hypothetical protein sS8_4765 [Methylocaldum marinum]